MEPMGINFLHGGGLDLDFPDSKCGVDCPVLLGGSWVVVISGDISPLVWVVSIVTLLITLLITTHEPPSRVSTATTGTTSLHLPTHGCTTRHAETGTHPHVL